MSIFSLILAVAATSLTIWDYPARQPQHEALRRQFVNAMRQGDTVTMEETCRKGVALLPDDPTWHYNLACSLAYFPKRQKEALDELEQAIDLGFRDDAAIANDTDLKRLAENRRYLELIEYAKEMKARPLMFGPMATVDATGIFGSPIALGEQNLGWDFELGGFTARMKLAKAKTEPYTGILYMNRDGGHSLIKLKDFPGITEIKLDAEGRARKADLNVPNILFDYPLFGNCSMAFTFGPYWRSLSRALMTNESGKLQLMEKMYLTNQFWVFPANADIAPVGTNGDVFASITPYYITTAGRSFSDRPYVTAALKATAALPSKTRETLIRRGLLTPTIQTLIRKSLNAVKNEDDYFTARAHPTAFPMNGVDTNRLFAAAAALKVEEIPPLVNLKVSLNRPKTTPIWPECTYLSDFAYAYILRAEDEDREFTILLNGASEYKVVKTHGEKADVKIEMLRPNLAIVRVKKSQLGPVNRVDIAIFGRNQGTGWGAPSYLSISRMDSSAPYSDPFLTPQEDKKP